MHGMSRSHSAAENVPERSAFAHAALHADADMRRVLDARARLQTKRIENCTVIEARRQPLLIDAVKLIAGARGLNGRAPKLSVLGGSVPGGAGELPARWYVPAGSGPFPLIVYFPGGGWVTAGLDAGDGSARGLALAAQAIVVAIDYRKAPEAKFPAAWDDARSAWVWLLQHAGAQGADVSRAALAGEGAGGCLALATAIDARALGLPPPAHILAVYPFAQVISLGTPSYIEHALAEPLNRPTVLWCLDKLLRSEQDRFDPRLALLRADLAGLPPVTIVNAMIDPLRSDGAMLEAALRDAGVEVERRNFDGVTHEFFGAAAVVEKARRAQEFAAERLRRAFDAAPRA